MFHRKFYNSNFVYHRHRRACKVNDEYDFFWAQIKCATLFGNNIVLIKAIIYSSETSISVLVS